MSMFSRAIGRDKKKNQTRDRNAAVLKEQQQPNGIIGMRETQDDERTRSLNTGRTASDQYLAGLTGPAGNSTAGQSAQDQFLKTAQGFDPTAAISKYASGMWDTAINDPTRGLKRQLTDLGGRSVGAGRLDTGFFDADQGDVIKDVSRGFGNSVASTAVDAARMGQDNNSMLGNFAGREADRTDRRLGALGEYGAQQQGVGLDLLAGRREEVENTAIEKAQRARSKKRGIGSAIGGVIGGAAGAFFGGPAGASAGYKLGSGVGGGF